MPVWKEKEKRAQRNISRMVLDEVKIMSTKTDHGISTMIFFQIERNILFLNYIFFFDNYIDIKLYNFVFPDH